MDGQHGSGATGRTAAARDGEVDADARARDQPAAGVRAVAGPTSPDTKTTDGAQRRGVGGIDSNREGGRFRVRLFMPTWRRRTTRDVLAAADTERERLAQDLHDGAQQHLTALRVRLALAANRFDERGETQASAVLQGFGVDLDRAIDELRDLAYGIYPALLTSVGLASALRSAAARSGRAVTVQASGVRRCTPRSKSPCISRALPRLTTRPNTPHRCRSRLNSPTPVARWTSPSATQARDLTLRKRRSARGSRTCATASPPSAARSRSTRHQAAERGCMAACRIPAGDNRCSTRDRSDRQAETSARARSPPQSRYHFESRRSRSSCRSTGQPVPVRHRGWDVERAAISRDECRCHNSGRRGARSCSVSFASVPRRSHSAVVSCVAFERSVAKTRSRCCATPRSKISTLTS